MKANRPGSTPGLCGRVLTGGYSAATFVLARTYSWWSQRQGRWTRAGVDERWGRAFPPVESPSPIWIHSASMGEVRVAGQFAHELIGHGHAVVASSMTEPGYELCGEIFPPGTARIRVPFDLPGPVERTLAHFRPRALVLVETEWWPNLLLGCARGGVPVFVINGRISERAFRRYRLGRSYWKSLLSGVEFFYMRSQDDAARVERLGVEPSRIAAVGSLKAANACDSSRPSEIPASLIPTESAPVWIAGCTRPGEEEIVLEAFRILRQEFPRLRLWLAPRHPDRFRRAADLVKRQGFGCALWTDAVAQPLPPDSPVVVVDQMGLLASLYSHAAVAFVGGSLKPYGGHNPLEPALAGAPVVFGPHMEEQGDAATLLLSLDLATTVHDAPSLAAAVAQHLRHPLTPSAREERVRFLMKRFSEARSKVADDLCSRLPRPENQRANPGPCAAGHSRIHTS